jgi:Zn-dependent protease with chaperone function
VRFWQTVEKSRMIASAVKVTPKQFPQLLRLAERCADVLQIPVPTVYVSATAAAGAHTFGTADDPYIVLNAGLIDQLSEPELLDVIGHECGHIQNDHAVYLTTLYFLSRSGNMLLRWGAKPAVLALKGWARRAEITCDRTALLCTRDLDVSVGCLVKLALKSRTLYKDIDVDEYLAQMEEARGPGRLDELQQTHPYLPRRVAALRLFAETTYYKSVVRAKDDSTPVGGISKEECDAKVSQLLSVLR